MPGHKDNSYLNGQWGKHGKKSDKKVGSKARRARDQNIIREQLGEKTRKSNKRR